MSFAGYWQVNRSKIAATATGRIGFPIKRDLDHYLAE
jgi:hypothetical protein